MDRRIPLTVVTGFLGSGKTTLLNRLLATRRLRDTAVIVNEFGTIGVDAALISSAVADEVVELADGCICCSARGALLERLADFAKPEGDLPRPARAIVETTGLADPAPLLAALAADPVLVGNYRLDGLVAVVDRLAGEANLTRHAEARRQVALADRIVITKGDCAPASADAALDRALASLNRHAPRVAGRDAPEVVLDGPVLSPGVPDTNARGAAPAMPEAERPHHHGHHGHHGHHDHSHGAIGSLVLSTDRPWRMADCEAFADRLAAAAGTSLLRVKGLVLPDADPDRPAVLHMVQGRRHPLERLDRWPPGATPITRLVAIGEALDEVAIRDLFAAYTGTVRADAPDRTAVEANPLAVPGMRFG